MSSVTGPDEKPQSVWQREVADEAASQALAAMFARHLETPCVVYLEGDLGAGKTLFTRAYIHALGYTGYVKSPSYGLLETYQAGGQTVLHLDLYRIEDPEELEYLALRDLFNNDCALFIEWPERGCNFLPAPDLVLKFSEKDESRFIHCLAHSETGRVLALQVAEDI